MAVQERLMRGAGILLPIGSLPSEYGVGSLGAEAFRFVDFLSEAGQSYWQILPVGPTGYGDSPYQSFSAFAGNPYFIDLELLAEQGLLTEEELADAKLPAEVIPYERLYYTRFTVLRRAAERFVDTPEFLAFCRREAAWLDDYALYMSLKGQHGEREWMLWDKPLRQRETQAIAQSRKEFAADVRFWQCCQYWFFCQWAALKAYANECGIQLIGDIPIYVAQDSADVWAHPELFELNDDGYPTRVAGVPPDYFSEDGQLWGNPLYRYDRMAEDGYAWWRARMTACARLYNVVRIDHFIGMARYFAIPASCKTAKGGTWQKGPGKALTDALDSVRGETRILAEDLGVLHPSVRRLRSRAGYPGMKVLLFAFESGPDNEYLPHHYEKNCVVYGGTHDNETAVGFGRRLRGEPRRFLMDYLHIRRMSDLPRALLRAAYASVADVAIFQMQDILALDDSARMNTPSTLGGNWQWRLLSEQLTEPLSAELRQLVRLYGRERNRK
ncbi:MAG: 4-alpha-glucanotransferase [Clostridia bacterium]|nr:4-alpha-glucanotransferase [Clostridia bacterium]